MAATTISKSDSRRPTSLPSVDEILGMFVDKPLMADKTAEAATIDGLTARNWYSLATIMAMSSACFLILSRRGAFLIWLLLKKNWRKERGVGGCNSHDSACNVIANTLINKSEKGMER